VVSEVWHYSIESFSLICSPVRCSRVRLVGARCRLSVVRCLWCWLLGCDSGICQEFSSWSFVLLYCMQSEQRVC